MNNRVKDEKRHPIPQWRLFDKTVASGELDVLNSKSSLNNRPMFTDNLKKSIDEYVKNQTIPYAAELVSNAIHHNNFEVATEAAELLLEHKEKLASQLIMKQVYTILNISNDMDIPSFENTYEQLISMTKKKTIMFPHNPYNWIDLAFYYSSVGMNNKAKKCVLVATTLKNDDRFILRSASRFLQHNDEIDRALFLLQSSERTKFDPWLLASEIALLSSIGKVSNLTKTADRMIESKNHTAFSTSELNSALGTLQIESGSNKKGKQYLKQSLLNPNENALAQVEYFKYQKQLVMPTVETYSEQLSFNEANALRLYWTGDYAKALEKSVEWQKDMPYSSRPAVFASYIACELLFDFELAKDITKQGLKANVNDDLLLNNYAFALISLGEIEKAQLILDRAESHAKNNAAIYATRGLLSYRIGDIPEARELYREAIKICESEKDISSVALATFHLAAEELRSKTIEANQYFEIAKLEREKMKANSKFDIVAIFDKLFAKSI